MNVVVTLEHRFSRTPDGALWTDGPHPYQFWTRYLMVFDGVKIVARVRDAEAAPAAWRRADGAGVHLCPIPDYLGQRQFLRKFVRVYRSVRGAVEDDDAIILRVSSAIAGCLEPMLARSRRPYGLEVVNDPRDVFSTGAVQLAFRPFLRWWFSGQLRRQCRRAAASSYVTEHVLQERYPCPAFSSGVSDVELPEDAILSSARDCAIARDGRFRLVTVGSLAQMYKAPDQLVRAVADCVAAGLDLELQIIGDGRHRQELESLTAALGMSGRVRFMGHLPAGAAVRAELDRADLFVLASRVEGLPRAMIEAMARALPCIGSTVGGIPELLAPEDLVPPGDAGRLAGKIREVLCSPARMSIMSARNLERAREYRDEVLTGRRTGFYRHVRRQTAAWLRQRHVQAMAC